MSGAEELRALEARLGTRVPAGVAGLAPEDLRDLLDAINDARRRQAAELQAAGDKALGLVPRLLRGPVRRITG